jgi:F-type H+-transporting ATPase subunit alpha
VIIFAGANGYLDDIPASAVVKFEAELMPFMEAKYMNVLDAIRNDKKITDETEAELRKAIEDFKASFAA